MAALLGEQYVLAPYDGAIVATVVVFEFKLTIALRHLHLLSMETFQVGHLTAHIGEVYRRVYLIGKQYGFLLIDLLLVYRRYDKKILIAYLPCLRGGSPPTLLRMGLLRIPLVGRKHLYGEFLRLHLLAIYRDGSRRDSKGTLLLGTKDAGKGQGL